MNDVLNVDPNDINLTTSKQEVVNKQTSDQNNVNLSVPSHTQTDTQLAILRKASLIPSLSTVSIASSMKNSGHGKAEARIAPFPALFKA